MGLVDHDQDRAAFAAPAPQIAQHHGGHQFFDNHNATAVDERAPFGGFNASGIGRELGRQGPHEFTETHVMAVPSEG